MATPRSLTGLLLLALGLSSPAHAEPAPVPGEVRVNQVGYAAGEPLVAHAMLADAVPGATYELVDETGEVAASGRLGPDVGRWSARWPHVLRIEVPPVDEPGRYRIRLAGGAAGTSPAFDVGTAEQLYAPLAAHGVRFFQAQRDGADQVPGVLDRRPSHLADRRARLHHPPRHRDGRLVGALRPAGGRVDVSGGWFDAGDYLKFVETTSYAASLLLVAAREAERVGRPVPGLRAEALFGVRWLDKVWLDRSRTLVFQVGLGDGRPGLLGDHDAWRLPEADDRRQARRGDRDYYLQHRPAFRTGGRRERLSPNLAGRTAAAFALAAQLHAEDDPERAGHHLRTARVVLARAETRPQGRLLTTAPHSYYEEDEWRDDLALATAEIALAGQALGVAHDRQRRDLVAAARWSRAYLDSPYDGWFTLARDDQGALAHAELLQALEGRPADGLAVTRADLVRDLADQLRTAQRRYAPPLAFGGREDPGADFAFGVAVTEHLYRRATGDDRFADVGARLRDWALGANAWGTSLVIGAGTTFPRCPHHQVANILGTRPGFADQLLGAVSNGPVARGELHGLGGPGDYARPCSVGEWRRYDGQGAAYRDDVRAYAATEPALDYVAVSVLAFVLESAS